ncbi:hypothetical protein D3C78_804560 [compost metagenome]
MQAGPRPQVFERGVLGLKLQRGVVATADLEDKTALVAVEPVVEILLAAQRLQRPAQSVMLAQQFQRLLCGNLRTGQTGAVNQRGEQHTTTPGFFVRRLYRHCSERYATPCSGQ